MCSRLTELRSGPAADLICSYMISISLFGKAFVEVAQWDFWSAKADGSYPGSKQDLDSVRAVVLRGVRMLEADADPYSDFARMWCVFPPPVARGAAR